MKKVTHHAALPYAEVPEFMVDLTAQDGTAAKALAFCILTAARTGEVIGARWREFDGDTWTVPGERMKAGREHRVPLSTEARAIVDWMRNGAEDAENGFVFPGGRHGKPLSNMAMSALLKRMNRQGITVHGFRSAFRDWCGESTHFPRELAEAALAHVLSDKTEAAYARGDLLAKRAQLMAAWARYCTTPTSQGEVIPLRNAEAP